MKSPLAYCLVLAVTGGLSFNVMAADAGSPAPAPKVVVPPAAPSQTDASKTDAAKTDAAKTDAAKTDAPKPPVADAPPAKQEAPKADAPSESPRDRKLTDKEEKEIKGGGSAKNPGLFALFQGYSKTFATMHDKKANAIIAEFKAKHYDVEANRHTFQFMTDLKDLNLRLKARLEELKTKTVENPAPNTPRRKRVAGPKTQLPARFPAPRPLDPDDEPTVIPAPAGPNRGSEAGTRATCTTCGAPIPVIPPYEPLREVVRTVTPAIPVPAAAPVTPAIPVAAAAPVTPAIPVRQPFGGATPDILSLLLASQFGNNPNYGLGLGGQRGFLPLGYPAPYGQGLTPAIPNNGYFGQPGALPWQQAGYGYGQGLTPAIPAISGPLMPATPLFAGGLGGAFSGGFGGGFGGGYGGGFGGAIPAGGFGFGSPAMPIGGGFNSFGGATIPAVGGGLPFGQAFAGNMIGGGAPALAPYVGGAGGASAFGVGGINPGAVGGAAPVLRPYIGPQTGGAGQIQVLGH